jgi:hypothetical protein
MSLVLLFAGVTPAACTTLDFAAMSRDYGKCPADTVVRADGTCDDVAKDLRGLRVELACKDTGSTPALCTCDPTSSKMATLGGSAATTYALTLRVRGIVEITTFDGGATYTGASPGGTAPFVNLGGSNSSSAYNAFSLTVAPSGQTFYLNAGDRHSTLYCDPVDYTLQLSTPGMASFTLLADSKDSAAEKNIDNGGTPIRSPGGVEPSQGTFDGQFLQLDVVSVSVKP